MSLKDAARYLAAQGRNGDSTLVHMTPREIHGMQQLAQSRGGSLTINPHTGLVEANFFDQLGKVAEKVAPYAAAYFLGPEVAGALGVSEAVGAGIAAGGTSFAMTGSLEKGLMTGLSAYGVAGLSGSLMNAGASDIAAKNVAALAESGANPIALTGGSGAQASALEKISAGFGAATSSSDAALQFAKDNYGKALMAASPILADQMVATKTPLPTAGSLSGPSYIRPYSMTRKVRQPEPGIGSREQNWFDTTWEAGTPYKAANGGIVALAGGGMTSQDAYDFLMGKKSDTGSLVNTVTQAPTFEGHYEFDTATGTSRFVPARTDMTPAIKPVTPTTTPTTDTAGITTLVRGAGDVTGQNQAKTNMFFDNMTSEQQADHQAQLAMIDQGLTPTVVKFLQNLKDQILYKPKDEPLAPVEDMSIMSPAAQAMSGLSGIDGPGVASTTPGNAVSSAMGGQSAAANGVSVGIGGLGGLSGVNGPGVASTTPGNAVSSAMGGQSAAGPGGGAGNGSGMGVGAANGVSAAGVGAAGYALGGISSAHYNLGSYSDGGRLLRGPGDGVSDSIPATIGKGQPARLADGEFVVPARIVSEIGNGSTEAGARKLYAMMDRIQAARKKTIGKDKVAANTKTDKYLPA